MFGGDIKQQKHNFNHLNVNNFLSNYQNSKMLVLLLKQQQFHIVAALRCIASAALTALFTVTSVQYINMCSCVSAFAFSLANYMVDVFDSLKKESLCCGDMDISEKSLALWLFFF